MSRTNHRHSSPVAAADAVTGYAPNPFDGRIDPPHSFWQSPTVQNVLPFITSLTVHAAIICIGLLTYKAITLVAAPHMVDQDFVPYSTVIVDTKPADGVLNVGTHYDPLSQAAQDQTLDASVTKAFAEHPGLNRIAAEAGGGMGNEVDSVIGVGIGRHIGKSNTPGHHSGWGIGDADGAGGALAKFVLSRGGADGLFGTGTKLFPPSARRVIYVCDASGSMIPKLEPLKVELGKAIMGLKAIQQFNVIFFRAESVPQSFARDLVFASPEGKANLIKFLADVTAAGETNPLPGIEQAFRQKPQMIILLTDGDFPDNDAVLSRVRQLNKEHKVRINTIAFVGQADTDVKFKELLETIAKENGGSYKLITPEGL